MSSITPNLPRDTHDFFRALRCSKTPGGRSCPWEDCCTTPLKLLFEQTYLRKGLWALSVLPFVLVASDPSSKLAQIVDKTTSLV